MNEPSGFCVWCEKELPPGFDSDWVCNHCYGLLKRAGITDEEIFDQEKRGTNKRELDVDCNPSELEGQ